MTDAVNLTTSYQSEPVYVSVVMDWITLTLSLIVIVISAHLLFSDNCTNAPPCIKGWIPWFGAALEFGKAPLDFIAEARVKVRR